MRKISFLAGVLMACIFLNAGSIVADPILPPFTPPLLFPSTTWVNPNYNNSWDPATVTGTARYYFHWESQTDTPVNVTEVYLYFENDVFVLEELTNFEIILPEGYTNDTWSAASPEQVNTEVIRLPFLAANDSYAVAQSPIAIQLDYKLVSSSQYYYGSSVYANNTPSWEWNEAQGANTPWAQTYGFNAYGVNSFGQETNGASGGSTGLLIPEPGTLLLLGSGLIGLAGYGRLRLKRRKK